MIELVLTYVLGTLIGGAVVTVWIWRSLWPHRLAPMHREA